MEIGPRRYRLWLTIGPHGRPEALRSARGLTVGPRPYGRPEALRPTAHGRPEALRSARGLTAFGSRSARGLTAYGSRSARGLTAFGSRSTLRSTVDQPARCWRGIGFACYADVGSMCEWGAHLFPCDRTWRTMAAHDGTQSQSLLIRPLTSKEKSMNSTLAPICAELTAVAVQPACGPEQPQPEIPPPREPQPTTPQPGDPPYEPPLHDPPPVTPAPNPSTPMEPEILVHNNWTGMSPKFCS